MMRLKNHRCLLPVIGLLLAGSSFFNCTKTQGKTASACDAPAAVSFGKNIVPLLQANCAVSGCHTGANPSGNLDLDAASAYSSLMRKGSGYVDTLHPDFSLLYVQMVSTSQPMPPTGLLSTCKTDLVLKWISQKAKNN